MESSTKSIWIQRALREWKSEEWTSRRWLSESSHPVDPIYFSDEARPPLAPLTHAWERTLAEYFDEPKPETLLNALNHGVSSIIVPQRSLKDAEVLLQEVRLDWIESQVIWDESQLAIPDPMVLRVSAQEISMARQGGRPFFQCHTEGGDPGSFVGMIQDFLAFAKKNPDFSTSSIWIIHGGDHHIFNLALLRACHEVIDRIRVPGPIQMEWWIRPRGEDFGVDAIQTSQMMMSALCSPVTRIVLDLRDVPEKYRRSLRYVYHTLNTENKLNEHGDPLQGSYFFHHLVDALVKQALATSKK